MVILEVAIVLTLFFIYHHYTRVTHTLTDSNKLHIFKEMKFFYIKSDKFKEKRKAIHAKYNSHCAVCGATEALESHHMSGYGLIPNEPLSALILLCRDCHQHEHDTHGYPQTYQEYMDWNHPIKEK